MLGADGADGSELVGDEVHAVAERRHEGHVGGLVEGREVGLVEGLVAVADRRPGAAREAAVDAAGRLVHVPLETVVGGHAGTAGRGDLEEGDLAVTLGVDLQKALVGFHPQQQALGVVETVDAEHDLPAAQVVTQRRGLLGGLGRHREPLEAGHVDPDRVRLGAAAVAVEHDRLALDGRAEQVAGRLAKVLGVALGVEADQVRAQHPADQVPCGRQDPEHFRGGPGHVPEEADSRVRHPGAQRLRDEHHVVVLNPERRVGLPRRPRHVQRRVCEPPVDGAVGIPEAAIRLDVLDEVVGQRPEHAVGHALVEGLVLGLLQRDPPDGEGGRLVGVALRQRRLLVGPAHGDPRAAAGFENGQQRRGEASQAGRPAVGGRANGGAVGDEDERHEAAGGPGGRHWTYAPCRMLFSVFA